MSRGAEAEKARDAALMKALVSGDEAALEHLMARYRRPLYAFLTRHVGDSPDADDLFQETWVRVVRSAERFDPSKRFSTWMFQIALNLCRDRGRRRSVRPEELRERPAEPAASGPAPDASWSAAAPATPEQQAARRQSDAGVREAIADLPSEQREVLLLRYYHGLSDAEVAEAAGIPKGTVKSRMHSAIRKLRGLLAPRGGGHSSPEGRDD